MILFEEERPLLLALSSSPDQVIAVDGWTLAGKSSLGQSIASSSGRRWIDLDKLLERDKETFIDHIDYSSLASVLDSDHSFALSGICMRAVLDRACVRRPLHVYVKRMHLGIWTNEDEAYGSGKHSNFPRTLLMDELRRYHRDYRPDERADYLLERAVGADGL